jgi:hypothetical protein
VVLDRTFCEPPNVGIVPHYHRISAGENRRCRGNSGDGPGHAVCPAKGIWVVKRIVE